ncbi:MAG: GNAT family N-acetyltransferase, partial [Gallionella sp.]|nr:GNAT family N-acetyltransferase [Gallionella sp.]
GVDNAWRGRGLGRTIASALLQRFRELGAERALTLLPLHDRTLAPFFRDLGFREESLVTLGRTV